MIIIRNKDARPIASQMTAANASLKSFPVTLLEASSIVVIYKIHKLCMETFTVNKIKVYELIGKLERENSPYILLYNKACSILPENNAFNIINADCVQYRSLDRFFPKLVSESDKNKLFYQIYKEFVECAENLNIKDIETIFNKCVVELEKSKLLLPNSVFITYPGDSNKILNANPKIGKTLDDGKIWWFDENYNAVNRDSSLLPGQPVRDLSLIARKPIQLSLKDVCDNYEKGERLSITILKTLTEAEVTEFIKLYPRAFSDLIRKSYSYYSESYSKYIKNNIDQFSICIEEDVEYEDGSNVDEYRKMITSSPQGLVPCFHCSVYVPVSNSTHGILNGDEIFICDHCCPITPTKAAPKPKKTRYKNQTCKGPQCKERLKEDEEIYCTPCLKFLRKGKTKCSSCNKEDLFNPIEIYTDLCENCGQTVDVSAFINT